MSSNDSVNLSLLENSHAFINEAVSKAIAAQHDVRQWQFAILALVQAAELSLKAALKAIHPILVYQDVDQPVHMVSLHTALGRLENPLIGGVIFSDRDKKRIRRASQIRNQITHADFELTSEYAAANFFELFGFVSDFQRRHLSSDLSKVVPSVIFDTLLAIRKAIEELVRRARDRIAEEKIDSEFLWVCPNCGEDTFVIEDGADCCYACSFTEAVVECPQCKNFCFQSEIESFIDAIDMDYEAGRVIIFNSYGYSELEACSQCLPKIRRAIQDERERNEMHRLEEEYHLQNR